MLHEPDGQGSGGSGSSGINEGSAESVTTIKPEYQAGGRGYSDGGYTGDGGVHEPAGVVHKGEYVVSQAELRNPSVVSMVRSIAKRYFYSYTHSKVINGLADVSEVSNSTPWWKGAVIGVDCGIGAIALIGVALSLVFTFVKKEKN